MEKRTRMDSGWPMVPIRVTISIERLWSHIIRLYYLKLKMDGFSKLKEKIFEKRRAAIKKFENIQRAASSHIDNINEIEIRCHK